MKVKATPPPQETQHWEAKRIKNLYINIVFCFLLSANQAD